MSQYQVLFFNHAGQVFLEKTLEADDDVAAVEIAGRAFCTDSGMGYEIRQGKCLVTRVFFGCQPRAAQGTRRQLASSLAPLTRSPSM